MTILIYRLKSVHLVVLHKKVISYLVTENITASNNDKEWLKRIFNEHDIKGNLVNYHVFIRMTTQYKYTLINN